MKNLKKFEELDYSTYMSASDKLDKLGQKGKSEEMKKHAIERSREVVDNMSFGILVGDVREFPNAKLDSVKMYKSKSNWVLQSIFKSGNNTHQISADVSKEGVVTWKEGNKFLDRRSVVNFQKAIVSLSYTQSDFSKFLESEPMLKPEDIKVIQRTFYV